MPSEKLPPITIANPVYDGNDKHVGNSGETRTSLSHDEEALHGSPPSIEGSLSIHEPTVKLQTNYKEVLTRITLSIFMAIFVAVTLIGIQWSLRQSGSFTVTDPMFVNMRVENCKVNVLRLSGSNSLEVSWVTGRFDGGHMAYYVDHNNTGELRIHIRGTADDDPMPWDVNETVGVDATTITTTTTTTTSTDSGNNGTQDTVDNTLDGIEVPEISAVPECHIELGVGAGYHMLGLSLAAEGEKEVDVSMLSVGPIFGPLDVSGRTVSLWTQGLVIEGSVNVNINAGTIDLSEVEVIGDTSEIIASVESGDVIIGPRTNRTVSLTWDQPCGYVCLPMGHYVDDSGCNITDSSTTTTTTTSTTTVFNASENNSTLPPSPERIFQARACQSRQCSGYVDGIKFVGPNASLDELFSVSRYSDSYGNDESWPDYGDESPLQINARARLGSIYLFDPYRAAVKPPGENRSKTFNEEEYRDVAPQLSDELKFDLERVIMDAVEYEDTMDKVTLSTFMPDSLWIASNSRTNLQFEPGILSAFSLTLLTPTLTTHRGRLYPGFCPYRPSPLLTERGIVSELLKGGMDGFNSSGYTIGHRTADGLFEYSLKLAVNTVGQNVATFVKSDISITNNPGLIAAIILSLVLSVILGISLTSAAWWQARKTIESYVEESSKNRRLAAFIDRKSIEDDFPDPDPTATASKGRIAKEATPNDLVIKITSPFHLIDQLLSLWDSGSIDSLSEFIDLTFLGRPKGYEVRLGSFEEAYRTWCAGKDYPIMNINGGRAPQFKAKNIHRHLVNDNSTQCFTHVVWKKPKNWPLMHSTPSNISEPDASLRYFIEQRCNITSFEYDMIPRDEFVKRYTRFCTDHDFDKAPVRNRVVSDFGPGFKPMTLTFLRKGEPAQEKDDQKKSYLRRFADWLARCANAIKSFWRKLRSDHFRGIAWQVVFTALVPIPILGVAFLFQSQAALMSYAAPKHFLINDALLGPYPETLDWGSKVVAWQNKVIFYLALGFWAASALELWCYYYESASKATKNSDKIVGAGNNPDKDGCCQKFTNALCSFFSMLLWVFRASVKVCYLPALFFFIGGFLAYIGLVAVWMVLGAVLNPFKFLPMAAGAVTLATAVGAKVKSIKDARAGVRDKLKASMKKRMEGVMATLKNTVLNANDDVDFASKRGLLSHVGKIAGDLPVTPAEALAIAKGDKTVIISVARKLGIDPAFAEPLVAIATGDEEGLGAAVAPLANKIGVEPDLAAALVTLASTIGPESSKRCVKVFMNEILKLALAGKIPIPLGKVDEVMKGSLGIDAQEVVELVGDFHTAITSTNEDMKRETMTIVTEKVFSLLLKSKLTDRLTQAEKEKLEKIVTNDSQQRAKLIVSFLVPKLTGDYPKLAKLTQVIERKNVKAIDLAKAAVQVLEASSPEIALVKLVADGAPPLEIAMATQRLITLKYPELSTVLNLLPEIASALVDMVKTLNVSPMLRLIRDNDKLRNLIPFPVEILSIIAAFLDNNPLDVQNEAIKLFILLIGNVSDDDNFNKGIEMLYEKMQRSDSVLAAINLLKDEVLSDEGKVNKALRIQIPPIVEVALSIVALIQGDPDLLRAALIISGDNTEENFFGIEPSVSVAISLLGQGVEGGCNPSCHGTRLAMTEGLFSKYSSKYSLEKAVVEPLAAQLRIGTLELGGLMVLERGYSMPWRTYNSLAEIPVDCGSLGVAALLEGWTEGCNGSVRALCYAAGIDDADIVLDVLELRQQRYQHAVSQVRRICPRLGFPAVGTDVIAATHFAALIQLSCGTDSRALTLSVLTLRGAVAHKKGELENKSSYINVDAEGHEDLELSEMKEEMEALETAVKDLENSALVESACETIAASRRPVPPLSIDEVHRFTNLFVDVQLEDQIVRAILGLKVDSKFDKMLLITEGVQKLLDKFGKGKKELEIRDAVIKVRTICSRVTNGNTEACVKYHAVAKAIMDLARICGIEDELLIEQKVSVDMLARRVADIHNRREVLDDKIIKNLCEYGFGFKINDQTLIREIRALLQLPKPGAKPPSADEYVRGARRLLVSSSLPAEYVSASEALKHLRDLSITLLGNNHTKAATAVYLQSSRALGAQLRIPGEAFSRIVLLAVPEPCTTLKRLELGAALLTKHVPSASSKNVQQWKALAKLGLDDYDFSSSALEHIAGWRKSCVKEWEELPIAEPLTHPHSKTSAGVSRGLGLPSELLKGLAANLETHHGDLSMIEAVRAVSLPSFTISDTDPDKRNTSRYYVDVRTGCELLTLANQVNKKELILGNGGVNSPTRVHQRIVEEKIRSSVKPVSVSKKQQKSKRFGSESEVQALAMTHFQVEGAIAVGSLDPLAIGHFARAFGNCRLGTLKQFDWDTHGEALILLSALARHEVEELLQPNAHLNGSSSISHLALKLCPDSDDKNVKKQLSVLIEGLVYIAVSDTLPPDSEGTNQIDSGEGSKGHSTHNFASAMAGLATGLNLSTSAILAIRSLSGDEDGLRRSLLSLATHEGSMSPVAAAFFVSVGSGDIAGVEGACEILDIDAAIAEGLVSLSGAPAASARACVPALTGSLSLEPEALRTLAMLACRDRSDAAISTFRHTLHFGGRSDASIKAIVGLFDKRPDVIKESLRSLAANENLYIPDVSQAAALVDFINGGTALASREFGLSSQGCTIAYLVLQLMRQKRGCEFEDVAAASVPRVFVRLAETMQMPRFLKGVNKDVKDIGLFLTAVFVAGCKGYIKGPEELNQRLGNISSSKLIRAFFQPEHSEVTTTESDTDQDISVSQSEPKSDLASHINSSLVGLDAKDEGSDDDDDDDEVIGESLSTVKEEDEERLSEFDVVLKRLLAASGQSNQLRAKKV